MGMKLDAVLARVAAADTTADRDQQRRTVIDTLTAMGLEVAKDGEVYDPAEGCYSPRPQRRSSIPEQQNVFWSGGRRR